MPSLQWSPSRFVTGWCHRGKNFCICQFFSASEKQDKICTVQTSNLTSDVRRLFTRWRGFPPSIVQPLFYSVHVMVARCEGSIKRKTRVTQEHFVLSGEMDQAPSRMLRNIIHVNDALTLSTDKIVHFHELLFVHPNVFQKHSFPGSHCTACMINHNEDTDVPSELLEMIA